MANERIEVRRLGVGDEERAIEIAERIYDRRIGPADVREFLANQANYLLGAYIGGEFAAFLVAHELQRNDGLPNMMYLHRIDTVEEHRRKGAASAVINELKHICRERRICKMWVIADNEIAGKLYESIGGKRCTGEDVVYEYEFSENR